MIDYDFGEYQEEVQDMNFVSWWEKYDQDKLITILREDNLINYFNLNKDEKKDLNLNDTNNRVPQ